MRKIHLAILVVLCSAVALHSCKTTYQSQSVKYEDYKINNKAQQSAELQNLIQPYKDSVDKNMSGIIAIAGMTLEKKQPEGTLGNALVDAMYLLAKEHFKIPIDAAFLNNGGIRLPSIPAGNISRGKLFELSPFDNLIVLQKLSGRILHQYLDHVADVKGWPIANGTYDIKAGKAVNIIIAGKPLDENAVYTIANLDYVANGGDDCFMLKGIPQINDGFVFRTAIINYFSKLNSEGKTINAKIENRVNNVN
jgi:2',3'-cyclic-nucleotide 2'-phosphodiesterase (5'-nucleotidase family)